MDIKTKFHINIVSRIIPTTLFDILSHLCYEISGCRKIINLEIPIIHFSEEQESKVQNHRQLAIAHTPAQQS